MNFIKFPYKILKILSIFMNNQNTRGRKSSLYVYINKGVILSSRKTMCFSLVEYLGVQSNNDCYLCYINANKKKPA